LPPEGVEQSSGPSLSVVKEELITVAEIDLDCKLAVGFSQTEEGVTEETVARSDRHWSGSSIWHMGSLPQRPNNRRVCVWCLKVLQAVAHGEGDDYDGQMVDMVLVLGRSQRQGGKFECFGLARVLTQVSGAILFENAIRTSITIA
jgi:hypothetical protein